MAFAQEVRDFLAGYKTVSEVVQGNERGKLGRETLEADKEYKAAVLALRGEELDIQRQRLAQSAAGAGAAAEAAAEEAETNSIYENFGSDNPQFDLNAFPVEPVEAFAGGGLVGQSDRDERTGLPMAMAPPGLGNPRPRPRPPQQAIPGPGIMEPGSQPPAAAGGRGPRMATPSPNTDPGRPAGSPGPSRNTPSSALTLNDSPDVPPTSAPQAVADEQGERAASMRLVVGRARDATTAAVDQLNKVFSVPRAALGGASNAESGARLAGMSMEELEEMRAAVDPNGSIPDYLKTAATMAEAYSYFQSRGETEKAVNVAEKILLAERQASQTLGTLAVNAMQEGNVAEACKLFNDACNRFPSAHEIRVTPDQNGVLSYVVKNEGEVLEQGRLEAREFLEVAGTVADGSLFMNSVTRFVHENRPKQGENPNQALALYGSAQSAAQEAFVAYQDTIDPRSGEGDPELLARARETAAAAAQAEQRALDLGHSSADLKGALERAAPRAGAQAATPGDTSQGNIPAPATRQEYDALPSGTRYRHPNGETKVKP